MITDKIQSENWLEKLDILTQLLRTTQHWNRQYTLKPAVFVSSTQDLKKKKKECHPQPDAHCTLKDKTCCYIREVNFTNVSFIDSALITKMVCV
jgi:hypothetical protein